MTVSKLVPEPLEARTAGPRANISNMGALRRRLWLATVLVTSAVGCASAPTRTATLPLSESNLNDFRREIAGRQVEVEFLSPPVQVMADGSKVHRLLTVAGRARFDETGTTLNLLNGGGQRAIPLERLHRVDGDHVFSHSAWGGLVGFAVGALFGGVVGYLSEGPVAEHSQCLASSPDWICYKRGDFATLYGALFALTLGPVGMVAGSYVDPGSSWIFAGQSRSPMPTR